MTGIGYYVLFLARNLLTEAGGVDLLSFDGAAVQPLTAASLEVRGEQAAETRSLMGRLAAVARKSDAVRRGYRWFKGQRFRQSEKQFDLFHALNFVPPLETKSPVLPLIHDLSFERLPHTHPADRVAFLRSRLRTVNEYPFINTLSHFSASEIAEVYGYPIDRIGVTHPGVNERMYRKPDAAALAQVERMGLAERSYFLTVGTVEPRKNHKVLVEAYVGLPAEVRRRCPLVIVGASGWGSLDVPGQDELVRDGSIRFTGYASEDVVHALYARARALLFPTLYEGFGIPVAEAMASGLQPIVSDIPVMREVAGDVGIYIDPKDAEAWRAVLAAAAADDSEFSKESALVARSKQFTWQLTAQKTAALYRRFE
ncbi:glycosyltransferase family 4 protein [Arvimicrobium flavum]|uniref:glycosyltransferase family 4 protein n=1 Tax=Arvimicrobium flavum TaxID=3393320 RepID=UPI00237B37E3|nr:glycosyltransferase family 1 protein [Mesorhizobium shangrilense]